MQHVALLITLSLATCCAPYDDKKDRLVSWKFNIFPRRSSWIKVFGKWRRYTYDPPIILRIILRI